MNNNCKWWLISEESVSKIRELMENSDISPNNSFRQIENVLNTELHTTNVIPSDYEKVELRGYDDKLFDVNKDDLVNDDLGNAELSERVSKDITDIVLGKLGKNN